MGRTFTDGASTLAYQYSFGPEREQNTSALTGGDFSNSTLRAQAHWLMVSLTHSF